MSAAGKAAVVVGAGIVGLSCALELAWDGWQVTVLERGRAMEQASWAAAGMLAVEDPENPPELRALAGFSARLYPEYLARIERLSGMRVPLRTRQALQGHARVGSADAVAGEAQTLLPALRDERYCFTVLEEASLDPRDLCAALPTAARAAGVRLREQAPAARVRRGTAGVTIELEDGEALDANVCVLAAGAWSGQAGLMPGAGLPVAPRKGQMIEVTLHADAGALPVVVRTPELYLVPRGDGRVVIGATVEHAGFDRAVDEAAGDRLWQAAQALWPPIARGRITARWTGLRPGFAAGMGDSLPILGEVDFGVWVATAHFRNGILLAPGSARLLMESINGRNRSIDVERFAPGRFYRVVLSR